MLKVVQFISRSDTVGGSQRHVLDLARHLAGKGHEVAVVSGPRGPFSELLEEHGIETYSIGALKSSPSISNLTSDFRAARALKEILEERSVELVACHSSKAGIIGRAVARRMRIPSVYTLHGLKFAPGIGLSSRALAWAVEFFARPLSCGVIAVSHYDGRLSVRSGIVHPKRLRVIPNAVREVEPVCIPETAEPVIVMPARLDAQKDQELLLRALARLADRPWRLELLGNGPFEDRLRRLSIELGISERVHFSGLVQDVYPYLVRARAVALISHYEGLPLAVLEGLACGLPIVASDVGGVGEAVVTGENGYLIPAGDLNHLVQALETLIEDLDLARKFGNASRRRYEETFRFEHFANTTIDYYRELVGR